MENHVEQLRDNAQHLEAVKVQMAKGLVNRGEQAAQITDGVFAGQNIILTGAPGIGKTELVNHLGQLIDPTGATDRILGRFQGTEDKLPADALGSEFYDQRTNEFSTRKGPVFSHIFFADEINRASTKTQSAINEAAQEGQVTIGNETLYLPKPFTVIGTQNEHDHGQATNPMSDALTDRFGIGVHFADPALNERIKVGSNYKEGIHAKEPATFLTIPKMAEIMQFVANHEVEDKAINLAAVAIQRLVDLDGVELVSPGHRSMLSAIRMAQANAVRDGKEQATTENMRNVLPLVLTHRVKSFNDEYTVADKQEAVAEALKRAA